MNQFANEHHLDHLTEQRLMPIRFGVRSRQRLVVLCSADADYVEGACDAIERFGNEDDSTTLVLCRMTESPVAQDRMRLGKLSIDPRRHAMAALEGATLAALGRRALNARLVFAELAPAQINDLVEAFLPASLVAPRPLQAGACGEQGWQALFTWVRHLRFPIVVA